MPIFASIPTLSIRSKYVANILACLPRWKELGVKVEKLGLREGGGVGVVPEHLVPPDDRLLGVVGVPQQVGHVLPARPVLAGQLSHPRKRSRFSLLELAPQQIKKVLQTAQM